MSKTRAPFLIISCLLLSLCVAAQTMSSPSSPGVARPGEPQAQNPANPVPPVANPEAPPQQQPTPPTVGSTPAQPNADDQARQALDRIASDLSLTAEQKTKLEPILANEIQLVHQLRSNSSMTTQQKQEKFKEQITADHDKIDAILTPEQKQKLAQLNQQKQAEQGQSQAAPSSPSTPPQNPKP